MLKKQTFLKIISILPNKVILIFCFAPGNFFFFWSFSEISYHHIIQSVVINQQINLNTSYATFYQKRILIRTWTSNRSGTIHVSWNITMQYEDLRKNNSMCEDKNMFCSSFCLIRLNVNIAIRYFLCKVLIENAPEDNDLQDFVCFYIVFSILY